MAALGLAGAPAPVAAAVFLGFVAAITVRHPANGLIALLLAVPFLLGEPKTVFFLLEPAVVTLVLLSFAGHRLVGRVPGGPFPRGSLLIFVAAAVVALPLDLRALLEDLWLFRSLDWPAIAVQGIPDISHLKYLDRVAVLALAAGLLAVAAQPGMGAAIVSGLPPLAVVAGGLASLGLLRFFGWLDIRGQYLTLSFHTWQNPDLRLTGVAWNPDYFALFLVLTIPAVAAVALTPGVRRPVRGLCAAVAAVGGVALVFTFQRAAYVALAAALAVLAGCLFRLRRAGAVPWVVAGLGLVVAVVAVEALVFEGRALRRVTLLAQDANRLRLWQTALRMTADHPVLGVGTGRYAFFFHEYAGELGRGFGPFWGTAHSLYLHLLAEQGVVGLTSFAVLFGGLWLGAARRLSALDESRALPLAGLLAALAGWLVYGAVQFTFRVPALVYLAALLAGTVVALAPQTPRPLSRRAIALGLVVALALLGARAAEALRRPVGLGYEAGFHRWERQPDGRPARWTRGRAALSVTARAPAVELSFRAPIREVAARPQQVRVWLDGRPAAALTLAGPDWQTVTLPVGRPIGAAVLLEVEPGYTFVPSRISPSRDDRRLGVMMAELVWRRAEAARD